MKRNSLWGEFTTNTRNLRSIDYYRDPLFLHYSDNDYDGCLIENRMFKKVRRTVGGYKINFNEEEESGN